MLARLAIALLYLSETIGHLAKPFTIRILHLMPVTGYLPANAYECRMAAEVVARHVNNRSDILPNHRVEIVVEDETRDGVLSAASTFKFLRSADKATILSPAIVAGYYTTGCRSLGGTLRYINMIAFSLYCSNPGLVNRNRFPNLYLTRGTAAKIAHGKVNFITQATGWKKIAVLGFLGNANDNANSQYMSGVASRSGIRVLWFDSVLDIDVNSPDLISSIQATGARVVSIWGPQIFIFSFLCAAHNFGFKGPRYAFLSLITGLAEPENLPEVIVPGCTKNMIVDQFSYLIAFGQPQLPFTKTLKSSFGYDGNEFDVMFDEMANFSRGLDYTMRFQCNDGTMHAVITLDKAEKALQKMNMTLRDYQERPELVAKVVNDSATSLDFIGLRIGRIKYSSRGELATDVIAMGYVSNQGKIQYYGVVRQLDGTTGRVNEDFTVELFTNITWRTQNGYPPRDSALQFRNVEAVPKGVFYTVLVMSLGSSLAISVGTFKTFKQNKEQRGLKILGLFSCIVLFVTAIIFAVDSSEPVWKARIVLLVLGVALANGVFFTRIFGVKVRFNMISKHRPQRTRRSSRHSSYITGTRISNFDANVFSGRRFSEQEKVQFNVTPTPRATYYVFVMFFVLNLILIASWLGSDPMTCSEDTGANVYDPEGDAYYEKIRTICFSREQSAWQWTLVSVHALLLLTACLNAYELKTRMADRFLIEFKWMISGVANSTAILTAAILLLLILSNDQSSQGIAMAFILIIFATTTSMSLLGGSINSSRHHVTNVTRVSHLN